jgi:hypothetical protein
MLLQALAEYPTHADIGILKLLLRHFAKFHPVSLKRHIHYPGIANILTVNLRPSAKLPKHMHQAFVPWYRHVTHSVNHAPQH